MIRPNAVFRSVSQALHVAFLMEFLPVTQKSNSQAVIERMMEEAGVPRETREAGSVNFSGLSPMDVRGQCSMVRAGVRHHCTPMEAHAIHAWFADKNSPDKIAGVHAISDHCAGTFTFDVNKARLLVCWNIHSQGRLRDMVTERAIAAETNISQSTVHRNIVAVSRIASALRRGAMDRLGALWTRDGLIEDERAAA
jgi:hypothetical protein